MFSRLRAVLLDKDGTLLDYEKTWLPINRDVAMLAAGGDTRLADVLLKAGGHDPVTNAVTPGSPFAAGSVSEIVAVMTGVLGPERTPPQLLARVEACFAEGGARHSVLLPGVRDALLALKARGYVLGLATNDTEAGLRASLAPHGVLELFSFSCGCDSGFGAKPGPGMVLGFSSALSLPVDGIAVVGDSTHDLKMARAARAGLAVGVLCGTGTRDDLARYADVVLPGVGDLVPLMLGGAG